MNLSDMLCANNNNSIDECELKLCEEYQQLIKNDKQLNYASEYLFSELIDDLILYIAFEKHFELKNLDIEKEEHDSIESSSNDQEMTTNNGDTYDNNKKKKIVYCKCSNCEKVVAVTKFASHLEHCFGIGRKVRLRKRKDMTDPPAH